MEGVVDLLAGAGDELAELVVELIAKNELSKTE